MGRIVGIVVFLIGTGISLAFAILQALAIAAAWATVPVIGPAMFFPVLAWGVAAAVFGVLVAVITRKAGQTA